MRWRSLTDTQTTSNATPLMTKTADDAHGALLDFFGRSRPKYMWTDSPPELIRAIKDMHVPHGKATP